LLPLVCITIGFVFSQKWPHDDGWKMLPMMGLIGIEIIAIFLFMFNIWHKRMHVLGSNPGDLLDSDFLSKHSKYEAFVITICEQMQVKINYNIKVNKKITYINNIAILIAALLAPLFFLITSIIRQQWGW
jgi:hypothetical protein